MKQVTKKSIMVLKAIKPILFMMKKNAPMQEKENMSCNV